MQHISVVIPCYNSSKSIEELYERLSFSLQDLERPYEIIMVNDCSKDDTLDLLEAIAHSDSRVKVIDLMFNVGQYRALMCGLRYSAGDIVITMDDDLQHPPEEIFKLVDFLNENPDYDAVFGEYEKKKHAILRKWGSKLVGCLNRKLFNKPPDLIMSPFRGLRRNLVDTIADHKTVFPVIGPMILQSSRAIANVKVKHEKRKYGTSNYRFFKLVSLTLDHIFQYSSYPLKVISMIGVSAAALSLFISIYFILKYFFMGIFVPGWTSIIVLLNFYCGLILFSIGIIGEYLIRILKESQGKPVYKERRLLNITLPGKKSE